MLVCVHVCVYVCVCYELVEMTFSETTTEEEECSIHTIANRQKLCTGNLY